MPSAKRPITSRVTVENPRPRKYASAAEKQAAFRARFPTICVRVEPKTADTIQKIGDASGRSQQETMLSLVKFALTNRDFVNLGLTEHKQLPRIEEPRKANPMKRKPTPAQIAARERFAEMARSGAFKRKAKRNPAKKRSKPDPFVLAEIERANAHWAKTFGFSPDLIEVVGARTKFLEGQGLSYNDAFMQAVAEAKSKTGPFAILKSNPAKKRSSQSNVTMPGDKTVYKRYTIIHPGFSGQWFYIVRDGVNIGSARSVQEAKSLIDMLTEGLPNPAKKTVSQKISQLTREGYPQRQAVAIALNEERAGKVKRNPISGQEAGEFRMTVNGKTVTRFFAHDNDPWANSYGFEYRLLSNVVKVGSPIRFTKSRAIVAIDEAADGSPVTETWEIRNLKFYQNNPRASNPTNFLKLPKYACIMPVSGGMMYGIDERTPVTIKFSNSELKSAYKCYLIPATVRESAGYRRMIAQGKTVYMSLAELKQLFRSFV